MSRSAAASSLSNVRERKTLAAVALLCLSKTSSRLGLVAAGERVTWTEELGASVRDWGGQGATRDLTSSGSGERLLQKAHPH